MDMRSGKWNVRSLYRAGSLITVARETAKCKSDDTGVALTQQIIYFSMEMRTRMKSKLINKNKSIVQYSH
jgi:hypothetical protein